MFCDENRFNKKYISDAILNDDEVLENSLFAIVRTMAKLQAEQDYKTELKNEKGCNLR